ncbi:MAG: tRNA lysidine(34) synthetase TilS [Bdellovibrionales bacterium]|nr:tRNA lysidine(34) synthetase TilS [Bdellovibrionales bacterium]
MKKKKVHRKPKIKGLPHRFLKNLRHHIPRPCTLVVAVSGGADSISLLHLLLQWQKLAQLKIIVAHVHHGKSSAPTNAYRLKALNFVYKTAQKHHLPFFSNAIPSKVGKKLIWEMTSPEKKLSNEEDLRSWRWFWLKQWRAQLESETQGPTFVVTAHTANDLLETRLMRLMRGTGAQGFLSMGMIATENFRPLIHEQKKDLLAYLRLKKIKWMEDPSNAQLDPLRNWIRKQWLPQLELRLPGASASLERSFALVAEKINDFEPLENNESSLAFGFHNSTPALLISQLLVQSRIMQKQTIARFFRQMNLRNYSVQHVEEILKRLDTGRREHKFSLLGHQWCISESTITIVIP